jgi:hypothetical protein
MAVQRKVVDLDIVQLVCDFGYVERVGRPGIKYQCVIHILQVLPVHNVMFHCGHFRDSTM